MRPSGELEMILAKQACERDLTNLQLDLLCFTRTQSGRPTPMLLLLLLRNQAGRLNRTYRYPLDYFIYLFIYFTLQPLCLEGPCFSAQAGSKRSLFELNQKVLFLLPRLESTVDQKRAKVKMTCTLSILV